MKINLLRIVVVVVNRPSLPFHTSSYSIDNVAASDFVCNGALAAPVGYSLWCSVLDLADCLTLQLDRVYLCHVRTTRVVNNAVGKAAHDSCLLTLW